MYDVVVIGGGPGGYAAAIRASQLGGQVGLVEAAEIGGTCVNRGCIPTKVWQRTASLLHCIRGGDSFGIKASIQEVDLKTVVARREGVSGDIRMGMEGLLANNGVKVITGKAFLKSPRQVQVEEQILETKKIILATGSRVDIPDLPGLEEAAWITDQMLGMTEVPASVLVWGTAGPIEVEMASTLNILGSRVFLATDTPRLLPREDGDTGQRLAQALRERGVEVIPRMSTQSVKKTSSGFEVTLSGSGERKIEVEKVLVSGRKPNSAGLGLEGVGVQLDPGGAVKVNEKLETSVSGIYAIGDVTGGWMLSHGASAMAVTAAENATGSANRFRFDLIPRGMWTIPEIGAVGLSEEEAEKRGIEVEVGDFPYSINGLAMARDEMTGAVKIVSDARYGEILGVHIVGAHATDLVGEGVLAMQLEATAAELARGIRVHPTFSETVVDAARDARKWALYLPKR